jgi:hypothetical protein
LIYKDNYSGQIYLRGTNIALKTNTFINLKSYKGGKVMKRTLALLICLFIIFTAQSSVKAATYDASGWWDMYVDVYILTPGPGLVASGIPWSTYIEQFHDDTFGLNIDGTTNLFWQGVITDNHYNVTACNWEEWIPIASSFPGHDDTGFFQLYDIASAPSWGIVDTTSFSFDLSSPNNLSGVWHWTMSGIVTDEPDIMAALSNPDLWYDFPPYAGLDGYYEFTGSAVPIPSAILLLGSGLIGIVGFRRKFRKP